MTKDKKVFYNKFCDGLGEFAQNLNQDNVADDGFFEFQIPDQSRVPNVERAKNNLRANSRVSSEDDVKMTLDMGQGEYMEVRFSEDQMKMKLWPVVLEYSCVCKGKSCSCLDEAYNKGVSCREKMAAIKDAVCR